MELLLLILYGIINLTMMLSYFFGKGDFYKFPFWASLISLGWFYPQVIGGYFNTAQFPPYAYENGMLFASLCTLGLWGGWLLAYRKSLNSNFWLAMPLNQNRLYYVGAFLCLAGFYFQWKLWNLPEEMLANSQWTGATVKYHFLAGIFKYGFLILWLLYLGRRKWMSPAFLVFLIPCLLLFLEAAILRGRRFEMMTLTAYILVAFWFVRGMVFPRWLFISGLVAGLILVNGIGIYRAIMLDKDHNLSERIELAVNANYTSVNNSLIEDSGVEFKNYIYQREAYAEDLSFDYGVYHWNRIVFNYVPAQIVGADVKAAFIFPIEDMRQVVQSKYGFSHATGSTSTGYADAFGSFGWLGWGKFVFIGLIMGSLYRYASHGYFTSQLLYLYSLPTAMVAITHGTNDILISIWIYFFLLIFPILFFHKIKWKIERF
ncbi:MAG: hypothetical protein ACI9ES_000160 [Oceanospirillaceae bacterium]|jgi:hypothetical protein